MDYNLKEKVSLIANEKIWIESNAVAQLNALKELQGVVRVVGLPDLHAGKTVIGATIETEAIVYPHLIGNDIGCGMTLFDTKVPMRQYKRDKWVKRLTEYGKNRYGNHLDAEYSFGLGSLGGGNHFAEFQVTEKIFNEALFAELGLEKNKVLLLVHSGARGYGEHVFSEFSSNNGIGVADPNCEKYMENHEKALVMARENRHIVAKNLMGALAFSKEKSEILDCCHNFIEQSGTRFIHRKGAVSTEQGAVVIPGSRGSLTYVVMPEKDCNISAKSLSHGSGRKYERSKCKGIIRNKYTKNNLMETSLKSAVICANTHVLYEEAPEVYKNIDEIIKCLQDFGLIKVVATLRPLITYKV